jgi:ribosomal RNA-processing protein 7
VSVARNELARASWATQADLKISAYLMPIQGLHHVLSRFLLESGQEGRLPLTLTYRVTNTKLTMARARKGDAASTSKNDNGAGSSSGRQIGAFKVLKIGSSHYSYMRAHEGDDEKTMFLVNLPIDTTDRHLKAVFANAGTIEKVKLWMPEAMSEAILEEEEGKGLGLGGKGKKKDSGPPAVIPLPSTDPRHSYHLLQTATSAHITFLDESSLHKALAQSHVKAWPDPFVGISKVKANLEIAEDEAQGKRKKKNSIWTADQAAVTAGGIAAPPVGLDYLTARHRALRPSLADVKLHVDSVIANYEYRRAHPAKAKSGIVAVSVGPNGEMLDEDGFTIVQSTGKYGRTADGQVGSSVKVARRRPGDDLEDEAAREKKRKRFELEDFYRFQRREQKREELANLRAKFRDDQEKVKKLKASRSFKPF